MTIAEQQASTMNNRLGDWELRKWDILLVVNVSRTKLKVSYNGVSSESNPGDRWIGDDHLPFGMYYIRYADKAFLILGKYWSGSTGEVEWKHQLNRMQQ